MATTDPNPPVKKDSRAADVWTDEADGTPGSPDTTLVVGNLGKGDLAVDTTAVNNGKQPTSNAEVDAANVETDGVYVSGYPLGTQEDDTTNPHHIGPNTNIGQKVDGYTGTTNGASATATVVPGDTTQAGGHSFDTTTKVLANQPGAKQPDLTSGADVMFGAQQGTVPSQELDTLSFKGGAGTLPANYGAVSASSGTSAAQFGQANNTPGELDTTGTAMPTAVSFNDGLAVSLPTSYDLTGGSHHIMETSNIDAAWPGLTAGQGVTAPGKPTNVAWTFQSGAAEITWTAPALSAPVQSAAVVNTADGGTFGSTGTYYYVVTATNNIGETVVSNERSAVVAATTSTVTLAWAAVTGATGYKVYRGTSAASENKLIATISSGSTLTVKDTGTAGTTAVLPASNTAQNAGAGHIREYVVYGWLVRDAAHLPADTAAADGYLTNGVFPTVTAHSRGVSKYTAAGGATVTAPATRVRIEHLTPGDFYFFRVAARNEATTGQLSALGAVTGTPTTPSYFLSEQKLDGTQVLVPGGTEPEGEALAALTFTNETGVDELGNALSGQSGEQLADIGEEGEDRI